MRLLCLTAIAFTLVSSPALACPDGEYEVCFIGCACVPDGGKVIDTIKKPFEETMVQTNAPLLEQWIIQSRNSGIGSAAPIPGAIRYQMEPYFPSHVLDRARYKIGDGGFFNAARNVLFNPDVGAVTLDDLIVFRSAGDAQDNLPLWAHELKHVWQYSEWGTRDFSLRYTRNSAAVENEAFSLQERFVPRSNAAPTNGGPYSPMPMPNTMPNTMPSQIPVRFCQTAYFTCAIAPAYAPWGTPCTCNQANGPPLPGSAF